MRMHIPPAAELITVPGDIILEHGGVLKNPTVALERLGQFHDSSAPVVLIFTGISPDSHVASSTKDPSNGWWEYMVGSGRAIDLEFYNVICINTPGGCNGSTGPLSTNPDTRNSYAADYPDLTLWDVARITGKALDEIEVNRVHCVIGPSMGGMTSLAWVLTWPGRTDHMINISASMEASAFAIALRSLQREIIRSDPSYQGGLYQKGPDLKQGMMMARKLGLITYRSADEWRQRFGRSRDSVGQHGGRFVIESYLELNAEKFAETFDPNSYLVLSQAMDWFSVPEKFDDPVRAFAGSGLRSALVVGVDTDFLFPEEQQRSIAECLTGAGIDCSYAGIRSHYGHDAFLIDEENFAPLIRDYLAKSRQHVE